MDVSNPIGLARKETIKFDVEIREIGGSEELEESEESERAEKSERAELRKVNRTAMLRVGIAVRNREEEGVSGE